MNQTKIEWATHSWNPIAGCQKVSEGCRNCYAERSAARVRKLSLKDSPTWRAYDSVLTLEGKWNGKACVIESRLDEPLCGSGYKIFVCSLSDLFQSAITDAQIHRILDVVTDNPQHTYYILTKHPDRMAHIMKERPSVAQHIWCGTSVENQRAYDERMPHLYDTPAAVRFISAGPLLGEIKMHGVLPDWVIVEGESGPRARPMRIEWVRSLRDQCVINSVPFYFKQWGEWAPGLADQEHNILRVGKFAAGRELDGQEWSEGPNVS